MGSLGDRVASQFLLSDRAGGRSTLLTLVQSFQILRFRFSLRALATHSLSDIHVFLKCKPRKKSREYITVAQRIGNLAPPTWMCQPIKTESEKNQL